MSKLDSIDRKILEALQANSRLTNQELADLVCLSPSPCSRRVKILEENGYFRGQVTLLDPVKVGLPISVFIQVTLSHQVKKNMVDFEEVVKSWPEVMECYLIAGGFDYLLRVAAPNLIAYQDFLEKNLTPTEGVDHIRSSFSLKQICHKTALPLDYL